MLGVIVISLRKLITSTLLWCLATTVVHADHYDNAMTAWETYKRKHGEQTADILDFVEEQKDPHIIAAVSSTGLDRGIDQKPSVERLNRLLGMLARKLRTEASIKKDDLKSYVRGSGHQFGLFYNFVERLKSEGSFDAVTSQTLGLKNVCLTQSKNILIASGGNHGRMLWDEDDDDEIVENDLQGFIWSGSFDPTLYSTLYQQFPWLACFEYGSTEESNVAQDMQAILKNLGDFSEVTFDFTKVPLPSSFKPLAPLAVNLEKLMVYGDVDLRKILSPQSRIKKLELFERTKSMTDDEIAFLESINEEGNISTEFFSEDEERKLKEKFKSENSLFKNRKK